MASTNSYDYTITRDLIITDALLYAGVISEGETPAANAVTEAARQLNNMLKVWAADGFPLWSIKRAYLLPVTGVASVTTVSHITSTYVRTTINGALASGVSSIVVDSITGVSNGDVIGLELTDNTMQYTTVNGAPAGSTITLTDVTTGAISDEADVYTYTTTNRIPRPLKIYAANIFEPAGSTSWPINLISRDQYFYLGNRTTTGTINQLYYDAALGSETADPSSATTWYGTFYFYPRMSTGGQIVEFDYQRPFQDFDAASDNPDIPQEFYQAITIGLAALLAPKYGVPYEERKLIIAEARMYRDEAFSSLQQSVSIFIQPENYDG